MVAHGNGIYLYDTHGKRYLDACGGALVVSIGHGVAEVVDAFADQACRVAFAHGTQFSSEALEVYAKELALISPVKKAQTFLVSGGSEAVETAIKVARQICLARGDPGRYKIIARWGSYHGSTLGALSVSGRPPLRRGYAPLLLDVPHIPPPYCFRCPFGCTKEEAGEVPGHSCNLECADALETEILRQGPETVAAFIAEPVVGATLAAVVPPSGYWPRIREICDRYRVLLIADEVMTGFGRTGRWFASDHWGLLPDILVAAKGASSGYYPLGVVLVAQHHVASIRAGLGSLGHGFTHANNVLGATVGLAVLRYLQSHGLIRASALRGRQLLAQLEGLRCLPSVGDVRGLGLMAGVEIVADQDTKAPYPREERIAEQIQAAAMARGVVVYLGTGLVDGQDGDALLLGPPFVIKEHEIEQILDVLHESILEVTG